MSKNDLFHSSLIKAVSCKFQKEYISDVLQPLHLNRQWVQGDSLKYKFTDTLFLELLELLIKYSKKHQVDFTITPHGEIHFFIANFDTR